MTPDLFMELLYDFVHGVMPADCPPPDIEVLPYKCFDDRFYVGSVTFDWMPGSPVSPWVMLRTGMVGIQYTMPVAVAVN